jgi:hypothetical protein
MYKAGLWLIDNKAPYILMLVSLNYFILINTIYLTNFFDL